MSSSVAKPVIKQIKDRQDALDFFEHVSLPKEDEETQEIIMNFPTVYIHNWQESGDFEVYVGESNDIFKRTRQHYDAASDNSKWQSKLLEKDASLFIIGHEHFNKSLTLDIENRLMHYMMSVDRVKHGIISEYACSTGVCLYFGVAVIKLLSLTSVSCYQILKNSKKLKHFEVPKKDALKVIH